MHYVREPHSTTICVHFYTAQCNLVRRAHVVYDCHVLIALLLAGAGAPTATARTVTQDLAVAHHYRKTDICRGEWRVIPDRIIEPTASS